MEPCYSRTLCYNLLYILFRFLDKKKYLKFIELIENNVNVNRQMEVKWI